MPTKIVEKTLPLHVLRDVHSALAESWRAVQEMCFHNPPGCDKCPLRCPKDENDDPIDSERIMDEDHPDYWDGCQYGEIPTALASLNDFMEN